MPERPRKKGRKKAEKTAEAKTVVGCSQDNTDSGCPEVDQPRPDTMSSQIGSKELESPVLAKTEFAMDTPLLLRSLSLDVNSSSSGTSGLDLGDICKHSSEPLVGLAGDLRNLAPAQDLCMFCTIRPKNTSFIHGRLGHQVSTSAEALFYILLIYSLPQGMLLSVCQEALENMPNLPDL